ncbi:MAG: hypothetical protein JNM79_07540 [Burkholderiales bacterium]|nr:hypothetical protein [Burkholderiales bacterium]
MTGCDLVRSFEAICESKLGAASFRVIAAPAQHELDLTQSGVQLTARGAASSGRLVLGITSAQMKSTLSATGNAIVSPISRRHCIRPQVELRLSVEPLKVAIAREHAPGSCEHNLTLAHEMKHVLVYERFLKETAEQVEAALKERIGERVRYASSRVEGERAMNAAIEGVVKPLIEAGMREAERRQTAVDTPEEYARLDGLQARCLR